MASWKFSGSGYLKRLKDAGYFDEPTKKGRRQSEDRERRLKHDERKVLQILVNTANEDGCAFRFLGSIAEYVSYHPKSVSWALRGLRSLGLVKSIGATEHGAIIYQLTMPERDAARVGWRTPKRPSSADMMSALENVYGKLADEERRELYGAMLKLAAKTLEYRHQKRPR